MDVFVQSLCYIEEEALTVGTSTSSRSSNKVWLLCAVLGGEVEDVVVVVAMGRRRGS